MKYSIKNFRVFDSEGVTLDIAPITILTGCNSSGKSSIAKSLLLLDSYFSNGRIDFTKRPYSLLGGFEKVLNRKSEDGMITIEYSTYSVTYNGEITVRLKFGRDEKDDLHNAFLQEICFFDPDGYILYQSLCGKDGYYIDRACMEGLKERFFHFLISVYQTKKEREEYLDPSRIDNHYAFSRQKYSSILRDTINGIPCREVIKKAKESQSLYALNIFDWLNGCTYEDIENTIYSHISPKSIRHRVSTGIKILVEDFRISQCDTFIEYFNKKESGRKFYNEEYKNIGLPSPYTYNSVTRQTCFRIVPFGHGVPTINEIPENIRNKRISEGLSQSEIELRWWNSYCCSFEQVYSLLMELERLTRTESTVPYTYSISNGIWGTDESSYILEVFDQYMNQILEEVCNPNFKGISYVTSSRANVQRMYTLEENSDFALLLRLYFETKRNFSSQKRPFYSDSSRDVEKSIDDPFINKFKSQNITATSTSIIHTPPKVGVEEYNEPNAFINKWLRQFGVAHHISIMKAAEGGVCVYLYGDENDEKGELLADKGYGITQLVSILLQIEIAIMNSNSLWIDSDIYNNNPKAGRHKQLIAIEEPEIHLHPNYQSLLADMFLEAYQKYNIHFIIETHSEYLIRRTQVITSEQRYESQEELNEKNPFRVYYITKDSQLYDMRYRTNGLFAEKFGEGFMDEASKMHMTLLKNDRR